MHFDAGLHEGVVGLLFQGTGDFALILQSLVGCFAQDLALFVGQAVPLLLVHHEKMHGVIVTGIGGVLDDFCVLCVVEQGVGVAFAVNGALLQGCVGFTPGDGGGVHAESLGHINFHGGVGGAHLEALEVGDVGDVMGSGDKVAVAEFAEHQGLEANLAGKLAVELSKLAIVDGVIQLLLVLGIGNVREIQSHVVGVEGGHVGRGAGGEIQGTGLGGLGGHTVVADLGIGEDLDGDLALALLFHKLGKLFVAHLSFARFYANNGSDHSACFRLPTPFGDSFGGIAWGTFLRHG